MTDASKPFFTHPACGKRHTLVVTSSGHYALGCNLVNIIKSAEADSSGRDWTMNKKNISWLVKHISLGGVIGHAAGAVGSATKSTVKGSAYAASFMTKNHEKRDRIRSQAGSLGAKLDEQISVGGKAAGKVINKAIQTSAATAGKMSSRPAEWAGASPETVAKVEKIGTVTATIAAGLMVGDYVSSAAIAAGAAAGTAGAAATTSGLAALGGGSIAAGGGGMAVGLMTTTGIATSSTVAVCAAAVKDDDEDVAVPLNSHST